MERTEEIDIDLPAETSTDWRGGYLASELIAALHAAVEKVPAELRPAAEIVIYGDWTDGGTGYLSVRFKRPETEQEAANRIGWYRKHAAESEAHERQTLAALKAKYEPA